MKRTFLVSLGAVLFTLAAFGTASAHAKLDHCTPAIGSTVANAPAQMVCVYSEEIDTKRSTMSVWNAGNSQVDRKDAHVDLNDADHKTLIVSLDQGLVQNGIYTVKWHAVTPDDNGISDGSWQFVVGSADVTPYPPTIVVQGETSASGTPGAATTAAPSATATLTPGATVAATLTQATATAQAAPVQATPATAPATGAQTTNLWIPLALLGLALLLGGTVWVARR